MTDKKKKLALMAAFSAVALIAIIFTGLKSDIALRLGDPYNIKIQGYDPYDPVRGKYIMFTIDTSKVRTSEDIGYAQSRVCYVTLVEDSEGFYVLDEAFLEKPEGVPYLKTFMRNYYDGSYFYTSPFDSYFLSEDISLNAETILNQNFESAYVTVRIWNGTGVVSGMYVDGRSIEELAAAVG